MTITMKSYLFFTAILLSAVFIQACGKRGTSQQSDTQPADPASSPVFTTPAEAAQKAQSDLLDILRLQPDLRLGVDAAALAAATPADPIAQRELDFNRLLAADSTATLRDLSAQALPTIVPLQAEQRVVTVVGVNQTDQGWQVVELAGEGLTQDLNQVLRITGATTKDVAIYQVPNIQATVFAVTRDGRTTYHTRHDEMPLAEGMEEGAVLMLLGRSARLFEERFGAEVLKQRLVR